ncbi:type II toxin-antitoxin system RelE/ParE family toxin [Armatimonas sp.]|uniref:type II toxin-antitoxin system RelE/ParE family toxin n=1 Tax=Armatimonas sp. TaxID=1872638 RepID=UPI0037526635
MKSEIILTVQFFRTEQSNEPVREWLIGLDVAARKAIGADIKTVQFGWPLGMPLIRKIETDLWEIRCDVPNGIARVLFTIVDSSMVLLHGFVKKSQKTPANDLRVARQRLSKFKQDEDEK